MIYNKLQNNDICHFYTLIIIQVTWAIYFSLQDTLGIESLTFKFSFARNEHRLMFCLFLSRIVNYSSVDEHSTK